MGDRLGTPRVVGKSFWGLAHPMSFTELALLDGRRPLPLWDVIGLTTLTLTLTWRQCETLRLYPLQLMELECVGLLEKVAYRNETQFYGYEVVVSAHISAGLYTITFECN
jgi:hypothetical protein